MLDRTEKELARLTHERIKSDKAVGYPGVDIDMQVWIIEKLLELDTELTLIQARTVESAIITEAKQRIMKELGMNESKAYKLIGKIAMYNRWTKVRVAEELLSRETLEGIRDA